MGEKTDLMTKFIYLASRDIFTLLTWTFQSAMIVTEFTNEI